MGWIRVKQARALLDNTVSPSFIYGLAKKGTVKATKLGGKVLIDEDSLNHLITTGSVLIITNQRKKGRGKVPLPSKFKHFSLD